MIPDFILNELYGVYGQELRKKLAKIQIYYDIYEHGARFEVDPVKDYEPAVLRARNVHTLIDREANFMVGKPPEIRLTCQDNDPDCEAVKIAESVLEGVLSDNNWSRKLISGARDCFIGGKVALKLNVLPDKLGVMFVPADGFVYETDLSDVDKITKIIFFYTVEDHEDRTKQRIWWQKYWMDKNSCKMSERILDGNGRTIEKRAENQNTGLDRIPATVIVNDGFSGDLDGVSDVARIAEDDAWYGRLKSGNIDALRKSMNQIIWISGAKEECFEHFVNAPGCVVDLVADPAQAGAQSNAAAVQVGTISNDFAYSSALDSTLANLRRDMYDALGIPDVSLDSTRSVITSGKGLKALYWPLVCRCEEKMAAWRPALSWLAETILYIVSRTPSLQSIYGKPAKDALIVTVDNQYPIPEDEDTERTLDMQEVANHTRSIKSYLAKWGGDGKRGLPETQALAELEQITLEQRMLEDSYTADLPPDEVA